MIYIMKIQAVQYTDNIHPSLFLEMGYPYKEICIDSILSMKSTYFEIHYICALKPFNETVK